MKRGFALLSRLGHLERGLDIWFKVREEEGRGEGRKGWGKGRKGKGRGGGGTRKRKEKKEGREEKGA